MKRETVLAGEKVALAEMIQEDQVLFQRWLSENSELRDLIADTRVPTMEDQMHWFKRVQQPDRKFFSLLTLPDSLLIGNAGFVDIDAEKKSAWLRITIGNPECQGKGLGSEAVGLLVRYAFEIARWHRLLLKVLVSNARAIRTYERAGFTILREDLQDGREMLVMSLIRE